MDQISEPHACRECGGDAPHPVYEGTSWNYERPGRLVGFECDACRTARLSFVRDPESWQAVAAEGRKWQ